MKKPVYFLCLFSMLCSLSACEKNSTPENISEPTSLPVAPTITAYERPSEDQAQKPPTPTLIPTPTPEQAEEYELSYYVTVDNGRELLLILHGKRISEEFDHYGINIVEVYDGDTLLQTILTQEAIAAEGIFDASEEYTEAISKDGGIILTDMNFDQSQDFGLMGWTTSGANIPSYYWLWNKVTQQYDYAYCLDNAYADPETKEVITYTRVGFDRYYTDYYQYTEEGKLELTKQTIEELDDTGNLVTEHYEMINGELQKIN